mgnify:CR=1 FL=1
MKLKILLPTRILLEAEVTKVIAEAQNGSFCLLPHHIDFVAALAPGLLAYTTEDGTELFTALAEGVLIKRDDEVLVSAVNGVTGVDLGQLHQTVREEFKSLDERDRRARSALARMEADFVRRFMELR